MRAQPEMLRNGHLVPGLFLLQPQKIRKVQTPFKKFGKCNWLAGGVLKIKVKKNY
jgi:hypothetical protein